MNKITLKWIPILSVVLTSIFPIVFIYCENADEANFVEIVIPIILSSFLGLAIYSILQKALASGYRSGIITILIMFIVTNFSLIEKVIQFIFPVLKYWHILTIAVILIFHLAILICKYISEDTLEIFVKATSAMFVFLIVWNIVLCVPDVYTKVKSKHTITRKKEEHSKLVSDDNLPNIYFLIFDEYANFPQMESYYDYGNTPLKNFLEKNNFSISYNGHNESISTHTVLTNLFNLDYVVSDSTPNSEKSVLRKNGAMFDLLESQGYNIDILETSDYFDGHMPISDSIYTGATTVNGETIFDLIIQQSVFYPFKQSSTLDSFKAMKEIVEYLSASASIPKSNTFTLAYFSFPHQPFIVDEKGAPIARTQAANWEDKKWYLGQYKYATKMMLQILDNIVVEDPNAVIFLQSDHGARATTHEDFPIFPMDIMTNNLNAVYYQGEIIDIEGLSSVNVARSVFSRLFETDYKLVDVPIKEG